MIDYSKLFAVAFAHFRHGILIAHAEILAGVFVGFCLFLLPVSMRLSAWLPESPAWPARLVRIIGGLVMGLLVVMAIYVILFAVAVWLGDLTATEKMTGEEFRSFTRALNAGLEGALAGIAIGIAVVFYLSRIVEPRFASLLQKNTKKAQDDELTDSRTIEALLPKSLKYDPKQYFAECERNGKVFIGLDRDGQPVTIDLALLRETHTQLVGPTGFGKGRAAQILLTQAVRRRDAVVVFDPKFGADEWLPSVLKAECEAVGVPFRYLDLCADVPQFNLIKNTTPRDLMQLLVTGLRLGRHGDLADIYRLAERTFAKRGASGEFGTPESLPAFFNALQQAAGEDADKLLGLLDQVHELIGIAAVQTAEGLDLAAVLNEGGVLYVAGSDIDEDVRLLQPMIVLRLVQLIRNRERHSGRHVVMLLDEVKYLLSTIVLNSLSMLRDRGCNLILAHQSLDELVCIDSDKDTTAGIVNINCTVRLCYCQTEPKTMKWIEDQTGKIVVNAESREITRNSALSEIVSETRRIQQIQRPAIDGNMIQRLPRGCGVLIGVGEARLVFSAPIKVDVRKIEPIPAPKVDCAKSADSLLKPGDREEL